jgi:hypothetical protein
MTTSLMKRPLLFFILIFLVLNTYSQRKIEFGLKAGILRSTIFREDIYTDHEFATNWQAGILLRVPGNKKSHLTWVFQPEIMFSRQGYADRFGEKDIHDYINVPLIAQRYLGKTGIYFELGPQIGFPLTRRYNGPYLEYGPVNFCGDIGTGYLHNKSGIGLNIRGAFGLTSADKDVMERTIVYSACLMYIFTRKKNH